MKTSTTLSLREQLQTVEAMIPAAEEAAQAELAFLTVNGDGSNPFAGSVRKKDDLISERRDLELQIKGHELKQALAQLQALDEELSSAAQAREAANENLRSLTENPLVIRWRSAQQLAIKCGWGVSYEQWAAHFLTDRDFRLGAASQAVLSAHVHFSSAECPDDLKFNTTSDRATIRRWAQSQADAQLALSRWQGCADRRQRLLTEHRELKAAS